MTARTLRHVLCPTDDKESACAAFAHALKLSQTNRCMLTLMHIAHGADDRSLDSFPAVREMLIRWGVLAPGAQRGDVESVGPKVAKVLGESKDIVGGIISYLSGHAVDLTVLATHAYSGFDRLRHSTFAESVARNSGTSTLFIPNGVAGFVDIDTGALSLARVLIPIAEDPDPNGAIFAAADMASGLGITEVDFDLLWVGPREKTPTFRIPESTGFNFNLICREGPVVDTILVVADERNSDLIAMASAGHQGLLDALRGSTTEQVLREAGCPTLMVQNWL